MRKTRKISMTKVGLTKVERYVCEYYNEALSGIYNSLCVGLVFSLIAYLTSTSLQ